jgi:hypothetical protein
VQPGRQSVLGRWDGMSKLRVGRMGKVTVGLVIVVVLVLLGGMAFLAFWNPPAPTAPVEKVLPDARFPK